MAKIVQLKPRERFKMVKRKYPKVLPFLTKEEQEKIQKKKDELALIKYILKNSPNY